MNTTINTTDEVNKRNTEKLLREMGDYVRNAMDDPQVLEIMLNPDSKVWIDKIDEGMTYLCDMPDVQAF